MNIFSRITAKTMRANRVRTIVTIIGVILSTSMITAVATFGTSFQRFLLDYSIAMYGNWHVAVSGTDKDSADKLAEDQDVAKAARLKVMGYARFEPVLDNSPSMPYLYVRALSEEALEMLPALMKEGRLPKKDNEIAVPSYLLANETQGQETKIGDTFTLELGERTLNGERLGQNNCYMNGDSGDMETFTPKESRTYTVVGIYDRWPDTSYSGAGYDVLAGPTAEKTEYQDVFIEMKKPRQVFDFAKEKITDGDTQVMFNESLLRWLGIADNSNLITILAGLMAILVVVIMAGSITLIYNAFSISLRERTVQFGLLSSIGATKKQLRRAMRYEAFFVSIVGIPLGILAGVGGIGVTLHFIGENLTNWIHGTKMGIPLYVPVWAAAAAAVTAFMTIMISVWIPSRRIKKITPMEVIRASNEIRIRPGEVKTGGWIVSLFGLEGMMAQKNYKRDRRKYRATVVSLTMSIGLFTAAGLFNRYLMDTGAFVLDAPKSDLEYTLYAEVKERNEDVKKIIGNTQGVLSVSGYYKVSFDFLVPEEWAQEEVLGYYAESFSDGIDMVTDLDTDGKVWIDGTMIVLPDEDFARYAKEQKADLSDYQDADHIRVLYLNSAKHYNEDTERYEKKPLYPSDANGMIEGGFMEFSEDGESVFFKKTLEIEFLDAAEDVPEDFTGYRNNPVMFLPESMYHKFEGEFREEGLSAVYGIQCEDASETLQELETKFNERQLDEIGYLENKREAYETDRNTIVAVKVLTYGFVILISLIAVANVFHTISTNLMLRRKEFAMLRSMGMSPKGFGKMMNYECLIYGIRSLIYGFVITLLISAALYHVLGAGADVKYLIPWGYLAAAAAGVFGVVFVTMLYTMRVIRRNNIVDELKMN